MAGGPGAGYCDPMTWMDTTTAPRRQGAVASALGALWSARSWRTTLHALAGLPLGVGGWVVVVGLGVVWAAALWSLIDGPTGSRWLAVAYVLVVVAAPVALPWCVRAGTALQRRRFRAVLGVELPAPPRAAGAWPLRLVRPWGASATWRQLAYHLLALVLGGAGGLLVASCWLALPLGAGFAVQGWVEGAWGPTRSGSSRWAARRRWPRPGWRAAWPAWTRPPPGPCSVRAAPRS